MKDNIIGLTVGIKYAKSFRIPDIAGDIIDNILYSDKTPFGADFFPEMQENSRREKTLYNSVTEEYLRINTDDLILGIVVNKNFEKKYAWIRDDIFNYFKNVLFKEYQLKNIKRIGIIFSHKIGKNKNLDQAVNLLTENKINDTENINISFSKKDSVVEALYRKGVSDYKNAIYNFIEIKEATLASLDYQYYYDPAPEDLRECFTEKVFDDAKSFLEKNYYSWLNNYEAKKDK
ncbi:MAG: hypothetical protein Q8N37_02995 [bacterium]|nr:hypothetical protein [bacterium]